MALMEHIRILYILISHRNILYWSIKYANSTHCGSNPVVKPIGDTWLTPLKEFLSWKILIREKFLTKDRYAKVSENSSTILENQMGIYMPRIILGTGDTSR